MPHPNRRSRLVMLRDGIDPAGAVSAIRHAGVQRTRAIPIMGGFHCHCTDAGHAFLAAHPDVAHVEIDTPIRRSDQETIPSGVEAVNAPMAWHLSQGEGVGVAVLDTGIDHYHPDLARNIAGGINLVNPGTLPLDDDGHGTHVAGIIAAARNGRGVVGVAPLARLYAVKVLDARGAGSVSDLILGLQWVVDRGIPVANLSLGSPAPSTALARAVAGTLAAGTTIVAAAGNDGREVDYPAAYPGVIAVAAAEPWGRLASFSNNGPEITVAAPGVDILSTERGGRYGRRSGTSMAAAHVSGVVALYLQLHPGATPDQVREALIPPDGGIVDAWHTVRQ